MDESLKRLQTDHLDVWQIYEVVHDDDPELHHQAGGAIEALDAAKKAGKVRFVGFSGMQSPEISRQDLAVARGFAPLAEQEKQALRRRKSCRSDTQAASPCAMLRP